MSYNDFLKQAMELIADDLVARTVFPLDVEAEDAWEMFTQLLAQDSSSQVAVWYQTYGVSFQAQFADYWHGFQYLLAERLGYV